ncbi:MAG: winged helix-turn-helix domain-containing protein [bacterium]
MSKVKVPTYDTLMNPIIQALKSLGGSGTIDEIDNKATEIASLSKAQLEVLHDEKGGQTEVAYRLAWARTYLKKFGILENITTGTFTKEAIREATRDGAPAKAGELIPID